jgi:hypothetical protein
VGRVSGRIECRGFPAGCDVAHITVKPGVDHGSRLPRRKVFIMTSPELNIAWSKVWEVLRAKVCNPGG